MYMIDIVISGDLNALLIGNSTENVHVGPLFEITPFVKNNGIFCCVYYVFKYLCVCKSFLVYTFNNSNIIKTKHLELRQTVLFKRL